MIGEDQRTNVVPEPADHEPSPVSSNRSTPTRNSRLRPSKRPFNAPLLPPGGNGVTV